MKIFATVLFICLALIPTYIAGDYYDQGNYLAALCWFALSSICLQIGRVIIAAIEEPK